MEEHLKSLPAHPSGIDHTYDENEEIAAQTSNIDIVETIDISTPVTDINANVAIIDDVSAELEIVSRDNGEFSRISHICSNPE